MNEASSGGLGRVQRLSRAGSIRASAAPLRTGRAGLSEGGLDGVDRIGLGEDGRGDMAGGRRLDMAAGGEDEGLAGVGEAVGDRPDGLAVLELDVDDRDVETAALDMRQRVLEALAGADDAVAERVEEILEHHRDQRLVFDDEDGTPPGHGATLRQLFRKGKEFLTGGERGRLLSRVQG
ncbi:MAG: hypothetical protein QOI38_753 [Sphingomonadales bacterium]|nr:hypothetical protein [Sphingomonadales bacterium]